MVHKFFQTAVLVPAMLLFFVAPIAAQESEAVPTNEVQPILISAPAEDFVDSTSEFKEAQLTKTGTLYISGNNEVIEDNVANDVLFAGGDLVINGDIVDNIVFVGGALEVNGTVYGDILFAGGALVVNGNVEGDIRGFGGSLFVNSEYVTGDVLLQGGQIGVHENTEVSGDLTTDGWTIERNSDENPMSISEVDDEGLPFNDATFAAIFSGALVGLTIFAIVWGFLMLLGTVLAGYFVLRVFPVFSEKTVATMRKSPWQSVGMGCLVLILGFFGAILLVMSILGIRLLILLALLAILAYSLGSLYARYVIGRMILKSFGQKATGRFVPLLVGVLVTDLLLFIFGLLPIINILTGLVSFFLSVWGLGAIVLNKYNSLRMKEVEVVE